VGARGSWQLDKSRDNFKNIRDAFPESEEVSILLISITPPTDFQTTDGPNVETPYATVSLSLRLFARIFLWLVTF
jgi:hypothetical protein